MARARSPFPAALRDLRSKLHLTQRELGAWFGVSETTIVRWETGVRAPSHAQAVFLVTHVRAAARPELAGPLAVALGLERAAPPAAPPASPPPPDARAIAWPIYRAAEGLDVPAAAFKKAIADVLDEWKGQGVTIDVAVATLRSTHPPAPSPRARTTSRAARS